MVLLVAYGGLTYDEIAFLTMGWTDEVPVLPKGCERQRCVR